jgi:pimeloyl-ACP methyl ester carboxylesterase
MVRAEDGRAIALEAWGPEDGHPVVYLHGMPGSRFGPRPSTRDLHLNGIRLITYDRPGYADSDRLAGRIVSHAAADVAAIARHFGIDRISVMGRSGGAPHAMACGALLPGLVENVAALVSLAPPDAEGLDWFEGMAPSNVDAFQLGHEDPVLLHQELMKRRAAISGEPVLMIRSLVPELSREEKRIVREIGVHRMLVENFGAIFGPGQSGEAGDAAAGPGPVPRHVTAPAEQGSLGWFDDCLSLISPWGFDVAAIEVPVLLWHGEHDHFSPLQHFHWLSERIPHVTPVVALDTAHLSAVRVLPRILRWLADPAHRAVAAMPGGDHAPSTRR